MRGDRDWALEHPMRPQSWTTGAPATRRSQAWKVFVKPALHRGANRFGDVLGEVAPESSGLKATVYGQGIGSTNALGTTVAPPPPSSSRGRGGGKCLAERAASKRPQVQKNLGHPTIPPNARGNLFVGWLVPVGWSSTRSARREAARRSRHVRDQLRTLARWPRRLCSQRARHAGARRPSRAQARVRVLACLPRRARARSAPRMSPSTRSRQRKTASVRPAAGAGSQHHRQCEHRRSCELDDEKGGVADASKVQKRSALSLHRRSRCRGAHALHGESLRAMSVQSGTILFHTSEKDVDERWLTTLSARSSRRSRD